MGRDDGLDKKMIPITEMMPMKLSFPVTNPLIIIQILKMTRNEKIISDNTYLGQTNKSTDVIKTNIVSDIKTGRTSRSKRLFIIKSCDNNNKERLKIKKAVCHSASKITFINEIISTGVVQKNDGAIKVF